jgi:hypothetical protein
VHAILGRSLTGRASRRKKSLSALSDPEIEEILPPSPPLRERRSG